MARPLELRTLVARETATSLAQENVERAESRRRELWLAITLPNLALEALGAFPAHEPVAVTEPGSEQQLIAAANEAARASGVRLGMKLSAALALATSLTVVARSTSAERASLESLAAWAHRVSPLVSLEPPASLTLEVAGSLKLFAGLAAVEQSFAQELDRRCWTYRCSAAPAPLAALWLARAGAEAVLDRTQLPNRIGALPLAVTDWPADVLAMLREMGARTVADCLRLPRDGFARRVGRAYLADLDKALGKHFDPRSRFAKPERFDCRIDLPEESVDVALFVAAVDELLGRLAVKLCREQAQIQSFSLELAHRSRTVTVEHFELVEPTSRRDRLASLAADRLERTALAAPVVAIRLITGEFQPVVVRPPDLFAKPAREPAGVLLERLRERFGAHGVYGVVPVADHRPERAWAKVPGAPAEESGARAVSPWAEDRPLWVLPTPVPLESSVARRHCAGTLQLVSPAERIESGWWDEQDLERDYYTAVGSDGQRLWVFRDLQSGLWHLHGIFG